MTRENRRIISREIIFLTPGFGEKKAAYSTDARIDKIVAAAVRNSRVEAVRVLGGRYRNGMIEVLMPDVTLKASVPAVY